MCQICWWEDDGQDDSTADEVWGGPNGDYSLSAARANFASHGHMYDLGKDISILERAAPERIALLTYVRSILAGGQPLDNAKLQKLIDADRNARRLFNVQREALNAKGRSEP